MVLLDQRRVEIDDGTSMMAKNSPTKRKETLDFSINYRDKVKNRFLNNETVQ